MSARIDQRNKGQQKNHQSQTNNSNTRDDYDYSHLQVHSQPHHQQVPYPSMPISSSATDNYNYYPGMNGYPFFETGTWNTAASSEALSYLGSYGQDYMQFPSSFDYASAMWPSYTSDYSSWGASSQLDPSKVDNQQLTMMYADYYQSSSNSNSQQPAEANGIDGLTSAVANGVDADDIDVGIHSLSINGNGDISHETPPTDTTVQEPTSTSTNTSAPKVVSNAPVAPPAPGKPMSWANVASQPAKPVPKLAQQPKPTSTMVHENGTSSEKTAPKVQAVHPPSRNVWQAPRTHRTQNGISSGMATTGVAAQRAVTDLATDPTLTRLRQANTYNPKTFDLTAKNARFFVIKSYSEDDIHRAIKYGVWCSTEHGNKRLDAAFKEREGKGPIYLFYSVNGSGHFCGMAQMMSGVDYMTHAGVWTQDKWKGSMEIKWIYVKDVPNGQLRHIRLENNENKPVTNSRDTQEVPSDKGRQVLKIIHTYRHSTSIFDDFGHYEKKEVEENGDNSSKRKVPSTNGSRA